MDDFLFHELGAYTDRLAVPDGWTSEHSPDTAILSRAENWAMRLRASATALEEAVAHATLLHKPAADDSCGP